MQRLKNAVNRLASQAYTPRSKKNGNVPGSYSRRLHAELLEDRRMLAIAGVFERLDGIVGASDVFSSSTASAYASAGSITNVDQPGIQSIGSEVLSRTSSTATAAASDAGESALAHGTAHALAQIATPIGATTAAPQVTLTAAQITSASVSGPGLPIADGFAKTEASLRGDFEYIDTTPAQGDGFYGAIYFVGGGDGLYSGVSSGWDNFTNMHIQVWKNYNIPLADVSIWGGGGNGFIGQEGDDHPNDKEWTVIADVVGYENTIIVTSDGGVNFYINFVTSLSDGDVITFTTQYSTDQVKPETGYGIYSDQNTFATGFDPGTVSAQANFAESISAYGFAYPVCEECCAECDPPYPPIIIAPNPPDPGGEPGPGDPPITITPPVPGDLDGDGDIDAEDSLLWADELAKMAAGEQSFLFVTTEDDESDGDYSYFDLSLREAVGLAADINHPGSDTIVFAPWVRNIDLNSTELFVASGNDLSIVGPGAEELIIDAKQLSRVLNVESGAAVELRDLSLKGGWGQGGGILSEGDLSLAAVEVYANVSTSSGGGILQRGGTLDVVNSTIAENVAFNFGGGIALEDSAVMSLVNSTVSTNSAAISGGGIHGSFGGGLTTSGIIEFSTITNNTSYDMNGGGLESNSGAFEVHNTIIAGNNRDLGGNITASDLGNFPLDLTSSYNLLGLGNPFLGTSTGSGNQLGVSDPLLGGLGVLESRTRVHSLMAGGYAVDAGDPTLTQGQLGIPLNDQRGPTYDRVVGSRVDIGAFESGNMNLLAVMNSNDGIYVSGELSLREALDMADETPGPEMIYFDSSLAGVPIVLTQGELVVDSDVTIHGLGADQLTIDAGGLSRVFRVESNTTATISDIMITGGSVFTDGGGIHSSGNLTLNRVAIEGNTASAGGGVYQIGDSLNVTNSTIALNNADYGGGLLIDGVQTAAFTNSTISSNTATEVGGGLLVTGGDIDLSFVTITQNRVSNGTYGTGGGISNWGGAVTLNSSIVADNYRGLGNIEDDLDGMLDLVSSAFNLIGTGGSGGLTNGINGNILGVVDPGLASLGYYGGPTKTHALLDGSLAIDTADDTLAAVLEGDQRDDPRVEDGDEDGFAHADIGAFELGADEYFGTL